MAEDLEERKKREEDSIEKRERYNKYKSNSRKQADLYGKDVENFLDNYLGLQKSPNAKRALYPPFKMFYSGFAGAVNWWKENTAIGLFFGPGSSSDFVSDGLYNSQSRDIVDLRLKTGDKYISDNTLATPEHKYAIEKNRLEALKTNIEANPENPENINLLKEALRIEKRHLDLMKEFTESRYNQSTGEFYSKSNGDLSLLEQMTELEKSYKKHLEIVEKSDRAFVSELKKEYNRYSDQDLDYKAFLPHLAGGVGTYPEDEAKKLIKRLGGEWKELIETINMKSLSEGDFKTKIEDLKKNGLADLDKFSNEEANMLLGLCDSEKYTRLTEAAFQEQIKGLTDKEKKMFLANPHFGGFKVGGLEGFSVDAVRKYLGNAPHINDYKKIQDNPEFIKDAYSLKGFCSNKKGFVTNPSTVFLYGDPEQNPKDLKNTINHEAAHSVLHALQKSDYLEKDISKVEKAFETVIKHKLSQDFPDFSMKEGNKIGGIKVKSGEKEKDLKSELEGIMGKGKTYPRLNKTMNHLKAMGIENPTPELIKTLDAMVYDGSGLINNEGRKVPNNLKNIEDGDIRFMVAVSYFYPTQDMDDKTQEQFLSVKQKMNIFSNKNKDVIDAHLDVFVTPVVSSGYNKGQHNEEKLVRFVADEQNISNLMSNFPKDTSVTKDDKKTIEDGIQSGFKVQKKYEDLQNDTYNLCENPNPIAAIWNMHKPAHAHSHERTDGSVMNHADVIPSKPRANLVDSGNDLQSKPRVSKEAGKEALPTPPQNPKVISR